MHDMTARETAAVIIPGLVVGFSFLAGPIAGMLTAAAFLAAVTWIMNRA